MNNLLRNFCDDDDNDGYSDALDQCPISDDSAILYVNSCNTKVSNRQIEGGCTLNDLFAQCNDNECASTLVDDLAAAKTISRKEKSSIKKCLR